MDLFTASPGNCGGSVWLEAVLPSLPPQPLGRSPRPKQSEKRVSFLSERDSTQMTFMCCLQQLKRTILGVAVRALRFHLNLIEMSRGQRILVLSPLLASTLVSLV